MDLPGICFVGCGRICAAHAKRLRGRGRLWFYSRSAASAERMNRQMGGAGVFESLDAALNSDRVDAVMITSPPEAHVRQTVQALEAGKTVFVEKPMCLSREEIALIGSAVNDKPLMVGENYYYKPLLARLKPWMEGGEIGKVERVRIRKCMTQTTVGWKSAHGALFEGGIHFVAFLSALLGKVTSIDRATFPTVSGDGPERHACLTLSYGDVEAELEYAWDTPSLTKGTFQHSSITGDRGRIVFESNGIYARLSGVYSRFSFPGLGDMMGYRAMMDDFFECIRSGRPPVSNFDRAAADLETVFRAYEMGGVGLPVET